MIIYLKYLKPFRTKYYNDAKVIHGEIRKQNNSTVFWEFVGTIVVCPVFEEFVFRGPILLLVQHQQITWSLIAVLTGGFIFGILHKYESLGLYADGTKALYCYIDCLSIALGGILLGLITIIGASLWPAIIAHGLWNGSVDFRTYNRKYDGFMNKCEILLQR